MNRFAASLLLCSISLASAGTSQASTATGIYGLYYTGTNDSGALLGASSQDSHWTVTYAYANGVSHNSKFEGKSYVVSSNYVDANWVDNTSKAQWIVPPGAATSANGQGINAGGDYLPGNGTSGNNSASYVYTLSFYLNGTGTGNVTNNVSISLTLAADDQAKVYVNPSLNANKSIDTTKSVASATLSEAWTNTSAITLQNYGADANANFVVGKNTLVVQVNNTNGLTGSQFSSSLNPSGLLVYQVGAMAVIDGKPVPEVGAWLPVLGAFGWFVWQRRRSAAARSVC